MKKQVINDIVEAVQKIGSDASERAKFIALCWHFTDQLATAILGERIRGRELER